MRFDVDVALKDEYRESGVPDYIYFVRWVKLEFLETLNPDYTAIESHDFAAYNLKLEGSTDEYPES